MLLALAVLHTWPLVTDPGRVSLHSEDEWLNAWAVSWIARQLVRDPLDLFGANMFYPTENAYAYTEPLLVPGLMGAPLRWLGASPMLTYNLLLLAGLTFTGLAMYWLVVAWTGDPWAGVLAGAVLAFSTAMLTRLAHLQALHLYALPLALLAFDRLVRRGRSGDACRVGLCVLCAALTSGYLAVFVTVALGSALLARAAELRGRHGARVLARLAACAVVTLAVLLVSLSPYLAVQGARPLAPDAPDVGTALLSYLSTAANLHYRWWSHAIYQLRGPLFPGTIALVLAGLALAARGVAPPGVRRTLMAVAAVGGLLSLGPLTPVYEWAYFLIPPLQTLRAPARFGILVVFSIATLAGLGLAALRARWPASRARSVVTAGALAAVTVECLAAPLSYRPIEYGAPIHRALRTVGPGALLELPIHSGGGGSHPNAWYLLASTEHWRPLIAGYGNGRPVGYDDLARVLSTFPSTLAVARLQALGVPWVLVHTSRHPQPGEMLARLEQARGRPYLTVLGEVGADRLYRIHPEFESAPGDELADLPWSELSVRRGSADAGSFLRAFYGVSYGFALQNSDRWVGYFENTSPEARLQLRLPVAMSGRFIDALTGTDLGPAAVSPVSPEEPPAPVRLPASRRAVILSLRGDVAAGSG
ncbi:MAG: hypothetical protein OXH69_03105 [Acidobacteria bacterium]|nr:hypothetical protein [Acidobacteriota bacterium]